MLGSKPADKLINWRRTGQKALKKGYIEEYNDLNDVVLRKRITLWLLRTFSVMLLGTLGIILLHGWKVFGFQIEKELLLFLGSAVLGEIISFGAVMIRYFFKHKP